MKEEEEAEAVWKKYYGHSSRIPQDGVAQEGGRRESCSIKACI